MDLDELRAFLAVAEAGSLAGASKRARTPRASLRRRIDELEARAGTQLLNRTRNGATLTEAGELLAGKATTILEQASALLRSLRDVGAEPTQPLRVAMPVGLPPATLATLFPLLRSALPDMRFEATCSGDPLAERLESLDAVVHFGEPQLRDAWITSRLVTVREWLVASPAYLDARGRPRSIVDLSGHDLLSWSAPGRPVDRWPALDERTFGVRPIVVSPDIHALRYLAAAGQGIALVPDAEVPDPALREDALEIVLEDRVGAATSLCLSIPKVLEDVPRVRRLLELVRGFAGAI